MSVWAQHFLVAQHCCTRRARLWIAHTVTLTAPAFRAVARLFYIFRINRSYELLIMDNAQPHTSLYFATM